jgi:hexosaminidase
MLPVDLACETKMSQPLILWPPVKKITFFNGVLPTGAKACRLLGLAEDMAGIEGFDAGPVQGRVVEVSLAPQAYRLRLMEPSGSQLEVIVLEYADLAGLRYGLRTLKQVLAQNPMQPLSIEDEPCLPQRAIMVDIARDRIPTQAHFYELIQKAAELKANHLQLYIEHSFAYKNHREVWQDASPLTTEELKKCDEYAEARGIVLSVCQNMFGHMERWLKHHTYAALGNFEDIVERCRKEAGPFSFNPAHPRSVSLPLELGRELKPCLRHGLLNFGGDETVDLGKGYSAQWVQEHGLGKAYGEHLQILAQGLKAQGWKLQFWADIALEYPEALNFLSRDLTALAWGYEEQSDFEHWGQTLQKLGFDWWACPGTSAWRSLVGRSDARSGSIRAAFRAARRYGASGMMITDWGDLGHRHTEPWAWLGWSEGLAMAWSGEESLDYAALTRWTFPEHWPVQTAEWMDRVSQYEVEERKGKQHPLRGGQLINSSLVFVDSILPWHHEGWEDGLELWQSLALKLNSFSSPLLDLELEFPLQQLRWLVARALLRRRWREEGSELLPKIDAWRQEGRSLVEQHRELWLEHSRMGGCEDSNLQFKKLMIDAPSSHLKI